MATFGLLTHRIGSVLRFQPYAAEADSVGFDSTVVFTPEQIRFDRQRVHGMKYAKGAWTPCQCAYPSVVHDLGFYSTPAAIRKVRAFKRRSGSLFTGYSLGHKWKIHEALLQTEFAPYAPETELYRRPADAAAMAGRYGAVMVKPNDGKQGIGIVKISKRSDAPRSYIWQESGRRTAELTWARLVPLLRGKFRPGRAIVQRWLDISDRRGGVYDIRALVQKRCDGQWQLTAMAVRQSGKGRIASNVAGGGSICEVAPFLSHLYGEAKAECIEADCRAVALGLPPALERQYRIPFIELGIDLGVERGGRVRIIEANIKPGKKIVRALFGEKAYADATLWPVRFAKQLSDRRDSLSQGS